MISVSCDEESGYEGRTGLEHFIRTYGLIPGGKSQPVNLRYGAAGNGNSRFNICITDSHQTDDFEEMVRYGREISGIILSPEHNAIHGLQFISMGRNSTRINLDIPHFIGRCLHGDLEPYWKNLLKPEKENLGRIPVIDVYERLLFLALRDAFEKLRLPLVCKSFWQGKRFAVCLTHDVDEVRKTYQWVTRPLMHIRRKKMGALKGQLGSLLNKLQGKEPFWTFDGIMEIEKRLDVRSSFYFLKEKSKVDIMSPATWKLLGRRYDFNDPEIRKVMERLCCGGWEIGLHGSYDSYCNSELLGQEKSELQNSLGDRIIGIRQHHLNLDYPGTWECHEKIGLEYDTTLGFKEQMGFRGGTCLPFHPLSGQKRLNLIEIPLAIMDTPLFKYKNDGLYNRFEEMIDVVSGFNGVLTLLWHHAVFNECEYPGWSAAYEKIIELCKKKDAWVTCAKELSDWWSIREKTGFDWDYDEPCLEITSSSEEYNYYLDVYLPSGTAVKKISNAEIIGASYEALTIRTDRLKNHERVKLEFVEQGYGN